MSVPTPAGFWRRYAAWSLDAAPLAAVATALAWRWLVPAATALVAAERGLVAATAQALDAALAAGIDPTALARHLLDDPGLHAAAAALEAALGGLVGPWLLAYAAVALPWHVLGEASARQGSPGKRLLGLAATDTGGARLGLGRAFARHLASALSWLTLNLGHLLAALPPQRRALHDLLAGARVLQATDAPLPRWARAWLALQGCAGLGALLWLWWRLSRGLAAALAGLG